jgi:hypothetical protein
MHPPPAIPNKFRHDFNLSSSGYGYILRHPSCL